MKYWQIQIGQSTTPSSSISILIIKMFFNIIPIFMIIIFLVSFFKCSVYTQAKKTKQSSLNFGCRQFVSRCPWSGSQTHIHVSQKTWLGAATLWSGHAGVSLWHIVPHIQAILQTPPSSWHTEQQPLLEVTFSILSILLKLLISVWRFEKARFHNKLTSTSFASSTKAPITPGGIKACSKPNLLRYSVAPSGSHKSRDSGGS